MRADERLALKVSAALTVVAAITAASFFFWGIFARDVPMGIGNMRGTALTVLVVAVPLLIVSMRSASRGSLRARFVWLAGLAYGGYNAVMFCFAAHFNSFFLLFTSLLALSFWSLVTLLRTFDLEALRSATTGVPVLPVAVYLLLCVAAFAILWLQAIVPATLENSMPRVIEEMGLVQNPVWVLDFAFTFPLAVIGSALLWQRRPWGYVVAGMMVIMLTVETAGVAVDQLFGHRHDPSAPLDAVPVLVGFTAAGLFFSVVFLRGVDDEGASP